MELHSDDNDRTVGALNVTRMPHRLTNAPSSKMDQLKTSVLKTCLGKPFSKMMSKPACRVRPGPFSLDGLHVLDFRDILKTYFLSTAASYLWLALVSRP